MKPDKILQADFEDILFEYRNKDYGAYELRKKYNFRMRIPVSVMLLLVSLLFLLLYFSIDKSVVADHNLVDATNCQMLALTQVDLPKPKVSAPPKIKEDSVQYAAPSVNLYFTLPLGVEIPKV